VLDALLEQRIDEICSFYLGPFARFLRAIIQAEGGSDAFIKAVQCARPEVQTFEQALAVACKTIRNRVQEFSGAYPTLQVFSMLPSSFKDPWTGESAPRRLIMSHAFVQWFASHYDAQRGENVGWAPEGAKNDPDNLNKNWPINVGKIVMGV